MTYFEKTYHPPGTAPGTLVSHEGADLNELKIHLIDYTATKLTENKLSSADECKPYLDENSVTWIQFFKLRFGLIRCIRLVHGTIASVPSCPESGKGTVVGAF